MYKNEMAIRNIIGVIPTYMRPPYSSCTAECGCEDDMKALGYHITYFVRKALSTFQKIHLILIGSRYARLSQ